MLDLGLIINVFLGILFYKATIAVAELVCLKLLSIFLGREISRQNYQKECDKELRRRKKIQPADLN